MNPVLFFTFLIFTITTVVGVVSTSPFNLTSLIFIFILIPILDFVSGNNKKNPALEQEQKWKSLKIWAPAISLYVITHFAIMALAAKVTTELESPSWSRLIILGATVGLYTGGLGITVAHELCHKKERLARLAADLLLSSVWYRHFVIEHVRGHHYRVSTPDDPASARKNENAYRFLYRTIKDSFIHALELDRSGVIFGVIASLIFTIIAAALGANVLIVFLIQSFVAWLLLELVNYVEHYGLTRKQLGNGRYEVVSPIHSWNSAHRFSNLIFFNLQRHSDHHAMAHLPYTVLKNHDEAPQLPSGYPAMVILALFPPLWFLVMNPKVKAWETKYQS